MYAIKSATAKRALCNYISLTVLLFSVIYACSLTFAYVEGDDAITISYHALGRNPSLQLPYPAYHRMMDVFLSVFPAKEPVLRVAAMTLTAFGTILTVILALTLVFDWLSLPEERKWLAALVALFACPEIYYLGIVYEPPMLAMTFVLAAHLLVRRTTRWTGVILSLSLFALGTACRWDIGSYGLVIVVDLMICPPPLKLNQYIFALVWGFTAVLAALFAITATGTGIKDFVYVFRIAQDEVTGHNPFYVVAVFQTLFTPAFLMLMIVGLASLVRKRSRLILIVVAGVLPTLPYVFSREPKMILPALPGLFLFLLEGFNVLWSFRLLKLAICLLLAVPWLIGVRVDSPNTAWGPGFEIQNGTGSAGNPLMTASSKGRSVSVSSMTLTLSGGFAVPTPEGPRPLGGHLAVLLWRWRSLINRLEDERRGAIQKALFLNIPIVQLDKDDYILAHLLQMGFTTHDPSNHIIEGGPRKFFRAGEQLTYLAARVEGGLPEVAALFNGPIVLCGDSSKIKNLSETHHDAIQILGPFSAILDLEQWK